MSALRFCFLMLTFLLYTSCGSSPAPHDEHAHEDAHAHEEGGHDEHGDEHDHDHAGEVGHEGEAGHEGEHEGEHEGDHEHEAIRLDAEQIERAGIQVRAATGGTLRQSIGLTGTVELDADRVAHLVPKVAGVVREARAALGATVRAGEVLAVIDSRELADARAQYLAARERLALAESLYVREADLWRARISAEQDYLGARQSKAEAEISLRSAEEQLHALGVTSNELQTLDRSDGVSFTRYEIRSPLDGVVIAKHITVGEFFRDDHAAFTVADLERVWVDLRVYSKDLASVRVGQEAEILVDEASSPLRGRVAQVGAVVAVESRTVSARVALENRERRLRPGLFVSARVLVDSTNARVVIPTAALQEVEGEPTLFVRHEEGFETRAVEVGRRDGLRAEILAGLEPGEEYVSHGSFLLKAERGKSEAKHVH